MVSPKASTVARRSSPPSSLLLESPHSLVPRDPLVESTALDVDHDVVVAGEADWPSQIHRQGCRLVSGSEHAAVCVTRDQAVDGVAEGFDGGAPELAAFIALALRGLGPVAPSRDPSVVRLVDVVEEVCDVAHAVAMLPDMLRDLRRGIEGARDDETEVVLTQHVRLPVARAGFRARVGNDVEPEAGH